MRPLREQCNFANASQIDALSYDFYPLQGMEQTLCADQKSGPAAQKRSQAATASRISALEIAIRAQVSFRHILPRNVLALTASAGEEVHRQPGGDPAPRVYLGRKHRIPFGVRQTAP